MKKSRYTEERIAFALRQADRSYCASRSVRSFGP
jgi:hypothetical protein